MKSFPNINEEDLPNIADVLRFIVRERLNDVIDFNNLSNVFLLGRRVGKIPSSSTDIVSTDKVNDVSVAVDGSYIYFVVNASGAAKWRRVALGIW